MSQHNVADLKNFEPGFHSLKFLLSGSSQVPRLLSLALLLTLAAIATDQFAAAILYTTSPLWATAACFFLVWRRGDTSPSINSGLLPISHSNWRILAFTAGHAALVLLVRSLAVELQPFVGSATWQGTLIAAFKLSVLAPTILLFPLPSWRLISKAYSVEILAAILVLMTYFPRRLLAAAWPWYGQLLGRFVFLFAGLFVPGLAYVKTLTPTLTGPELDVTIITACSGINGIELFQILFGLVVLNDWNALRKGRLLGAYFAGLAAMLGGNALRLTSLVVLGNHGLSSLVSRFHISAGWIFFSLVFLAYLSLAYPWMLETQRKSLAGAIKNHA